METERLKQFCAVVESQSLTRASELTGITLSGLSRSMKNLQEELHQELFKQHGRGIIITDDGLELYRKAKEILERVTALSKEKTKKRELRLGCLEVFAYNFLGKILTQMPFQLTILDKTPGQLEVEILNGRLDFGLTYLPFPLEGVEHLSLSHFKLNAFARLESFAGLGVEQIPFIVPSSGLSQNVIGVKDRDGWPDAFWERNIAAKVDSLSTAIDLCAQGIGAVFIPEFVANEYNLRVKSSLSITALDLPRTRNLLSRELYFVKTTRSQETTEMKSFTSAIRRSLK